ncbi:MAG: hypothetical protein DMG96_28305 [Acidobacteria bacterium]|nr:MAG: hypothetical protein DMG96_28305 [Acidobacteriota bacterium]
MTAKRTARIRNRVGRAKLPKGAAKGRIIPVRFTPDDLRAIEEAAKAQNQTISEWGEEYDSCDDSEVKPRSSTLEIKSLTALVSARRLCFFTLLEDRLPKMQLSTQIGAHGKAN